MMNVKQRAQELKARLGVRLARSASKKRKNWLDRLFTRLLRRAISDPKIESEDFMKDELVDAEIEFDIEELVAFENRDSRN